MYLQAEMSSDTGVKFDPGDMVNSSLAINSCNKGKFWSAVENIHFFIVFNLFSACGYLNKLELD